jgi:hypothetical protein
MLTAIFSALIISFLNAVAAFIIIKIALKKDWKKFNKLVFGSMVIRYFIIMIVLWLCYEVFDLDKFAFSLTFMLSTFVILFSEIIFLHFRSNFLNLQNKINK